MHLKTASILAFAICVICILWLVFQRSLFGDGPATITIQAAAVLLMIWARVTFGRRSFHAAANPTAGGIVANGPYRFLRHPIYAAIIYFLAGSAIAHPSASSLAAILLADLALLIRMRSEEILLLERYPEYGEYARRTARILPGVW